MSLEHPITAIVLAAGLSTRMGQCKALLPLGNTSVLERVVKNYHKGGITDIKVVLGHNALNVRQRLAHRAITFVDNPDYAKGMYSSVLAGVSALGQKLQAFFVHPVDIPLVRPATIARLVESFNNHPAPVVYPAFDGVRGHPPLLHINLAPRLRQWHGEGGLRCFLQKYEADSRTLAVADQAVLMDMDTPADYGKIKAWLKYETLPTRKECLSLMRDIQAVPAPVQAHCRAVERVALYLADALEKAGAALDKDLVGAAALLHDIARKEKNHALAGARLLEKHGFFSIAPIVASHMDMDADPDEGIDEAQVVYLADKLVAGDQRVSLDRRFAQKMDKYGKNPSATAAILKRKENAFCIQQKIEQITGVLARHGTGVYKS